MRGRGAQPQSYTATQDNIRGDTAELADRLVSDDGDTGRSEDDEVSASSEFSSALGSDTRAEPSDERSPLVGPREPPIYDSFDTPQPTADSVLSDDGPVVQGAAALKALDEQWDSLRRRTESHRRESLRVRNWDTYLKRAKELSWRDVGAACREPIRLLPPVILGLLLNVLDGVSYGMITFPASSPIFANFEGDGVSMFFVTCVISQLVYTLGGSIFHGGNGSMMIEVVPFYHILVRGIVNTVGETDTRAVVATTMVAFALSSVLTGLAFLLLGWLRLGVLIGYFPRHILVGCIGGVGVFLLETGMSVSGRLESEEGFKYNLATLRYFTKDAETIAQWCVPLALAVALRVITAHVHHPLVFPLYFLLIPCVFYAVTLAAGLSLETLRDHGWMFQVASLAGAPFYRFYTYFDFRRTNFSALVATLPTQLALVFFGILHVPLNVPALGVSISEDNVDTDRELLAHGVSNIAAGLFGTVPNYLCYVNSVLFYKVGGGSRLSGVMLALGTMGILLLGPGAIGYLPVPVVGALIFVLGIDLVREAVWDTFGRVNLWEYCTIWVIVVVMTISDFVVGIIVGVLLACLFFVMQTSRRTAVRAIFDGRVARSTVRRHYTQRRFLERVGRQTLVLKLQGFLFFGTINSVERIVRQTLDVAMWSHRHIRFLLLDFSLVSGLDFSAAETLTRVQRQLSANDVLLVLSGLQPDSDVGMALRRVDLWMDRGLQIEVFASLNEALEWTENEYLRGMYTSGLTAGNELGRVTLSTSSGLRVVQQPRKPALSLDDGFENSPRNAQLHEAAKAVTRHWSHTEPSPSPERRASAGGAEPINPQPTALVTSTLGPYTDTPGSREIFKRLVPHLKEMYLVRGTVLWEEGDHPDACMSCLLYVGADPSQCTLSSLVSSRHATSSRRKTTRLTRPCSPARSQARYVLDLHFAAHP